MKISIILAHPNEASFNHAIAHQSVSELQGMGCEVMLHDLYKEGFDPLCTMNELSKGAARPQSIQAYCDEVKNTDGIVIVHPNWWGQPPAILKGWVDRVLCQGVAYRFKEGDRGDGVAVGLLKAKTAVVFNTSNTPPLREREIFNDPLQTLWKKCIFELCGIHTFQRRMFGVVVTSTPEDRAAWLSEVGVVLRASFSGTHRP